MLPGGWRTRRMLQGFISYSHEDFERVERFKVHLGQTERDEPVTFWIDHRIQAGWPRRREIEKAIDRADFFIVKISADFGASPFIRTQEMQRIQARMAAVNALMVPMLLVECTWPKGVDAAQAVPTLKGKLKGISRWGKPEHGYNHAHNQLLKVMDVRFTGWRETTR